VSVSYFRHNLIPAINIAFSQGRRYPLRARYAARPSRTHLAFIHNGVPRVRNYLVSYSNCTLEIKISHHCSEGRHAKYHYLIAGVQGDFTRSLVENPPQTLWTRELKFAGVSNTSTLYKRGIRVCTGTGLGAALSTCLQSPDWYLIWIGSDQEKTFGPTISRLIHENLGPERLCLCVLFFYSPSHGFDMSPVGGTVRSAAAART
jgi:hypothetical protein